jgi:hypothetical protein
MALDNIATLVLAHIWDEECCRFELGEQDICKSE